MMNRNSKTIILALALNASAVKINLMVKPDKVGKEGKDVLKAAEKEGKEVRIFEDDGLDLSEAFSDFADFEPIRPFGNPVAMHSTDFLTSNLIDSPELLVEDAEMAENLHLMIGRFGNGLFKLGKYMDRT